MAAAPKTLKVTARPSKREGNFWSTSFWLFEKAPHETEFTVTSPAELESAMRAWAMALPLPEGMDGWNLHVSKTTERWPAGFKALASKTAIVVPLKAAS